MGGTDKLDHFLSLYRPTIRGKKRYFAIVLQNMLNITVVAAWRSHCSTSNTKLSPLEFLGHITLAFYKVNLQVASEYQREPRSLHMNLVTTDCTMFREQLHTANAMCARRTRKHGAQNATSDYNPNVERYVFTFFKMSHNISVMCCLFIFMHIL